MSGTDPTYKEWKRTEICNKFFLNPMHGSYLQGMETSILNEVASAGTQARILPTRNGNNWKEKMRDGLRDSTDPTYKEWKQ